VRLSASHLPAVAALVITAGACETESVPYRFDASVMPGSATVVIDGLENNFAFSYQYASYAAAVADMHVPVVVTYQGTTRSSEITPGWCVQQAEQMHLDLGEPTRAALTYGIISLAPYVESAQCDGTKGGFAMTP
jgi:hypothetical protein